MIADFSKVDLARVDIADCRMEILRARRTVGSLHNLLRIKGYELRI